MGFLIPRFKDIVDIFIIAFLIYQALLIVRKSGGYQVLWGLLSLLLLYFVASIFELQILSGLLSGIRTYWIMAIVILFQPELRAIISRFNLSREFRSIFNRKEEVERYGPVSEAVGNLAFRGHGALIVIEGKRKLTEYLHNSEIIDSNISSKLIMIIFDPRSALHDGAVVIRGNRLFAAKVVLPLSKNSEYVSKCGTRHLAGIGISEVSDATAIIVSEETQEISVAKGGVLSRGVNEAEIRQILTDAGI